LIVADDQLSLAIGKRGQNVRLASELVGWELNIFTAEQWASQHEPPSAEEPALLPEGKSATAEPEPKSEERVSELTQLKGAGPKVIQALEDAGFLTIASIAAAVPDDLTPIKGVGKIKAERLIEEAKSLTGHDK